MISYLIFSASCSVFSLMVLMISDTGLSKRLSFVTWKKRQRGRTKTSWLRLKKVSTGAGAHGVGPRLCSEHVSVPAPLPSWTWTVAGLSGS